METFLGRQIYQCVKVKSNGEDGQSRVYKEEKRDLRKKIGGFQAYRNEKKNQNGKR